MHLDAPDQNVREPRGPSIDRRDAVQGDAELIFVAPGGNIAMGAGVDVGINPHRDRRADFFGAGNPVDPFQLRFALDVETQDPFVESIFDFFARFADAGEGAFRRGAARFQDPKKLAARNDVEPRSGVREQFQDRAIRVGFNGITDEAIQWTERCVKPAIMIENRASTVNVKRRTELFHHAGECDFFTVKLALAIMKRVHRENVAQASCLWGR